MQVRWQSSLSEPFGVSSGVWQGGVLSPILFTVYIDDLLLDLHQLVVGCFWKQHFVGALCYADDVALLAQSPCALRLMLNRCYQFTQSHSLVFNADKTQLICFGSAVQCTPNIQLLGHVLSHNLSDAPDSCLRLRRRTSYLYLFLAFRLIYLRKDSHSPTRHGSRIWQTALAC